MDRDEIRNAMEILVARVHLDVSASNGARATTFSPLDRDEMQRLGMTPELADRLSGASWWDEMIQDVAETPEFCEPDASDEELLQFARDVVREYIYKRL